MRCCAMTAESPVRKFLIAFVLCCVLGGLGGLTMAELGSEPEARPRFVPPREQALDFTLTDEKGRPAAVTGKRGDVVVLTWLYATCWDLCPAQAAEIFQAVEMAGGRDVVVNIISVDPVGDTPERVNKWLDVRRLGDLRVHFLIGSREELAPVWAAYGIVPVNASPSEAYKAAESTDRLPRAGGEGGHRPRGAARTRSRSGRRRRARRSSRTRTRPSSSTSAARGTPPATSTSTRPT